MLRAQELFGQTGLSPRSFSNHKVVPDFPGWAKPAALTKALVQKTTCSHVDVVLARVRMCHPRACSMRHAPPSLPQHCPLPPTHPPSPSPPRSLPAFLLAFSGLTLRAELSSRPQPLVHAREIDREGEREREAREREREGERGGKERERARELTKRDREGLREREREITPSGKLQATDFMGASALVEVPGTSARALARKKTCPG